jgi:hypothetical protein
METLFCGCHGLVLALTVKMDAVGSRVFRVDFTQLTP